MAQPSAELSSVFSAHWAAFGESLCVADRETVSTAVLFAVFCAQWAAQRESKRWPSRCPYGSTVCGTHRPTNATAVVCTERTANESPVVAAVNETDGVAFSGTDRAAIVGAQCTANAATNVEAHRGTLVAADLSTHRSAD